MNYVVEDVGRILFVFSEQMAKFPKLYETLMKCVLMVFYCKRK